MQEESVSLRLKNGSSDKVYNAALTQEGDGWTVTFSYGRYGSALKPGSKTATPVPYEKAKPIYDKLVTSKTSKGYSPDGDGVAFSGTEHAGRVTGFQPQLLNAVDMEDIMAMVAAEPGKWVAQEKHDGERRGLKVEAGKIVASNRKGLEVPVRKIAAHGLSDFEIDCEDMGEWMAPFDMLSIDGTDLRDRVTAERLDRLDTFSSLCKMAGADDVFRDCTTWDLDAPERVMEMVDAFRKRKAEGLVFKRLDVAYQAGRPNSGGSQLKLKFTNDITVRVASRTEGKRSVAMEMLHDGAWTGVGNVTIPANHDMPEAGDLVDVNYLYAYEGGSLYQPVFRGKRTDYEAADCTTDKLVYKAEADAAPRAAQP